MVDLIKSSNSELEFSRNLDPIADIIEEKGYNEAQRFIKEVDRFCKKGILESKSNSDEYILLNANNFSMYILDRMMKRIKNDSDLHKEVMEDLLKVNKLESWVIKSLNDQFTQNILVGLRQAFKLNTEYWFEIIEDEPSNLYAFFNSLLGNMHLDVINNITKSKILVCVGLKGNSSATLDALNIMLLSIEDVVKHDFEGKFDFIETLNTVINSITEIATSTLIRDLLLDSDIEYLIEKYCIDLEDFKLAIGEPIANYVVYGEDSDLLKDILEIAEKRNSHSEKLKRKEMSMHKKAFSQI